MPNPVRIARRLLSAILSLAIVLPAAQAAGNGEFRIGGTGNALGAMRLIAAEFARAHPHYTPEVLLSIGSSGGIRAVGKGAIQVGLSSRLPRPDDGVQGLTVIEYARTPTVFVVQESNLVSDISREEVANIYAGRRTAWPNGERIRPVMRQPGDDNTQQIAQLDPRIAEALALAATRQGLSFASNDQDAAEKLEAVQGSFGVATIGLIRSEARKLRPLRLEGIDPTPENAQAGRYPLVKRLYLILPPEPTAAARDFAAFLHTPAARAILTRTGHTLP